MFFYTKSFYKLIRLIATFLSHAVIVDFFLGVEYKLALHQLPHQEELMRMVVEEAAVALVERKGVMRILNPLDIIIIIGRIVKSMGLTLDTGVVAAQVLHRMGWVVVVWVLTPVLVPVLRHPLGILIH